jgi:gliding motility-associated-like protein
MTPRILPITGFILFFATTLFGQRPTPALYGPLLAPATADRGACNNAGTVSLNLNGSAQSSNPSFLCFGDSLFITHDGNADLSGDPNPATTPGIGYAFYSCPPTVGGMTLTSILTDPCIFNVPPSPTGIWITTGNTANGNTVFANNGFLQQFFNAGNPVQIWFAPVTVDDFFSNTYEEASPGAGAGPCVDVNINDAFSVVYLNEVVVSNLDVSAYGVMPGTGSFTISGGLPQFNGSTYSVSIYQRTNPAVTGTVTSGPVSHGGTVSFTVPNDNEFVVEINDGTGCATTFFVIVPSVVIEMDCIDMVEGSSGCVNVRVRNYSSVESLQLFFHWDPAVVSFQSISSPSLSNFQPAASSTIIGDSILGISHFAFPGDVVPNGDILFTICYTAVGNPGDCSPIILKTRFDGAKNEAIIGLGGGNDAQIGISSLEGCVCIVESGNLQVSLTPTPISCSGQADGTLKIDVIGGTAPFTYNWAHATNGAYQGSGLMAFNPSSITIPSLIPGLYSVTITDSGNPTIQEIRSINISTPSPIFINLDNGNPSCFGDTDGFLLANVLGGTAPYFYSWSNGVQGVGIDLIDNLAANNYSLTITDSNGCTQVGSRMLETLPVAISILDQQDVTCTGMGDNGSILIGITGGTINPGSAYTIIWSPTGSGTNLTGLSAGVYSVTVTDDNNCVDSLNVTITAPSAPVIDNLLVTSAGCIDKANGTITAQVTPAPGAPNLTYLWTGPGGNLTGQQITGLLPGNYFLTVVDDKGCTDTDVTFVDAIPTFQIVDTFITLPICPGAANGSLGLQLVGGTQPYSFTWSNIGTPSPNSVNSPIAAGTYQVTITDAEGCGPTIASLTLLDPPAIVASITGIDSVSCNQGLCDGTATVTAGYTSGPSGNFTYSWSSGELDLLVLSSTATQLCGGMQQVTISDGSCAIDTFLEIPVPEAIIVDPVVTNISCFGEMDGVVSVQVTGGSPAYSYIWAVGDTTTTNAKTGLGTGFYQVTIVDQKGCVGTSTIVDISEPQPFVLSLDNTLTKNVRCEGEANGAIAVNHQGGNPGPLQFLWSAGGSLTNVATNLTTGTYTVTATDSRGCEDTLTHVIGSPPAIFATIPLLAEPPCYGESTLLTVSNATGGNGPAYTFAVDNGLTQALNTGVSVFADQSILVTVFDAQGCSWDTLVSVGQPDQIYLDLGQDIELELGDSVTIGPVNDLGAFGIVSYVWNPATDLDCASCEKPVAQPGATTTYSLYIEDANGCSAEDEVTLTVRSFRRVYIPSAFSPNFDGFNDLFTVFTGKGVERIDYIRIFDRWGNQVYELLDVPPGSDGSVTGWDGHFRGKLMDPGVFVYAIQVRFLDNQELIYRGDVQIMR